MESMNTDIFKITEATNTTAPKQKKPYYTLKGSPLSQVMIGVGYTNEARLAEKITKQPDLFSWWQGLTDDHRKGVKLLGGYKQLIPTKVDPKTGRALEFSTQEYALACASQNEVKPMSLGVKKIITMTQMAWDRKIGKHDDSENPIMYIPLEEMAIKLGEKYDTKANRQNTKRKILKYISEASDLKLLCRGNRQGFKSIWLQIIFNNDTNCLEIQYTPMLASAMKNTNIFENFDERALLIPEKDKLTWELFAILNQHYRILKNRKDGTNDYMKISTIIDKLAAFLPTKEEAGNKPMQRIGELIIRAADNTVELGLNKSWGLCKKKKQPFTKAEEAKVRKNFNLFVDAYMTFDPAYRDEEFDRNTEHAKKDGRIGNFGNNTLDQKGKK